MQDCQKKNQYNIGKLVVVGESVREKKTNSGFVSICQKGQACLTWLISVLQIDRYT